VSSNCPVPTSFNASDLLIESIIFSLDEIENLACCAKLRLVDLSKNEISFVSDHLSLCEKLETLQLSHNKLSTAKSISNIVSIPKLHELDLSKNKLDGEYGSFLDILSECKHLKVLSLKGNPVIKNMPHYRRMVVSRCKGLTVLDGNEVCREERRRCNAWGAVISKGGTFNDAQEADRRELIKILSEQSDKNAEERQMKAMTRRLSDVPQSKPPLKASALSPTTWGLGYVALELKPRSSLVSTCLKKAFDYLNPALQRSSM
jgi:dynein assembly factor 1